MVFLCLCILSFSRADTLGRQLYILGGKLEGFETDTKKLEQEYLHLLNQYDDPKDIGRIYAALTDMYCQSGLTDPFSAAKYAQKALEYPLALPIKIRVHHNWGDALQVQNSGATGSELAKARREAVRPYLYGIKVALEHEIPDERVGMPGFEVEHYDGPDLEEHKRIAEENEKHFALLKKAHFINDMVFRRDICVGQTVSLYSKKPFATDELRQIATEILEDTDAVDKLISKVDAAVKKRLQKELGKISEEVFREISSGSLKDISPEVEIPEIPAEKEVRIPVETQAVTSQGEAEPPPATSGLSPVVLTIVIGLGLVALVAIAVAIKIKRSKA